MKKLIALLITLCAGIASAQNGYGANWIGPFDVYAMEICLPNEPCYFVPSGDVFQGTVVQGANNFVLITDTGGGFLQSQIELLATSPNAATVQEPAMTVDFGADLPIPGYGNCKFNFGGYGSFTFTPANNSAPLTVCGNEIQWVLGGSGGVSITGCGGAQNLASGASISLFASTGTSSVNYACGADWLHTWATANGPNQNQLAQLPPAFVGPFYNYKVTLAVTWEPGLVGNAGPEYNYDQEMYATGGAPSMITYVFGYYWLLQFDLPTSFTSAVVKATTDSGMPVPKAAIYPGPPSLFTCPTLLNFVATSDAQATRVIASGNEGGLSFTQTGLIKGCTGFTGHPTNFSATMTWTSAAL